MVRAFFLCPKWYLAAWEGFRSFKVNLKSSLSASSSIQSFVFPLQHQYKLREQEAGCFTIVSFRLMPKNPELRWKRNGLLKSQALDGGWGVYRSTMDLEGGGSKDGFKSTFSFPDLWPSMCSSRPLHASVQKGFDRSGLGGAGEPHPLCNGHILYSRSGVSYE